MKKIVVCTSLIIALILYSLAALSVTTPLPLTVQSTAIETGRDPGHDTYYLNEQGPDMMIDGKSISGYSLMVNRIIPVTSPSSTGAIAGYSTGDDWGFGVVGRGGEAGVSGVSPHVGVYGSGETGVMGDGSVGVSGTGTGFGVYGSSTGAPGVYGKTTAENRSGVVGEGTARGSAGVRGSGVQYGLLGESTGDADPSNNIESIAVYGTSDAAGSIGVMGDGSVGVSGTGTGFGVRGFSTGAPGVYGETTAANRAAVVGVATGEDSTGVRGQGVKNGVLAKGTGPGSYGVFANQTEAVNGTGVLGEGQIGVIGIGTSASNGIGVIGKGTTTGIVASGPVGLLTSSTGTGPLAIGLTSSSPYGVAAWFIGNVSTTAGVYTGTPITYGQNKFVDSRFCGQYGGATIFGGVTMDNKFSVAVLDSKGSSLASGIVSLTLPNQGDAKIVRMNCDPVVLDNGASTFITSLTLDDGRVYLLDTLRGTFRQWCDLDDPATCRFDQFRGAVITSTTTAYLATKDTIYMYGLNLGYTSPLSLIEIASSSDFTTAAGGVPVEIYNVAYDQPRNRLVIGTSYGIAYVSLSTPNTVTFDGLIVGDYIINSIQVENGALYGTGVSPAALGKQALFIRNDITNTAPDATQITTWDYTEIGLVTGIERASGSPNIYLTAKLNGVAVLSRFASGTLQEIFAAPNLEFTSIREVSSDALGSTLLIGTDTGLYAITVNATGSVTGAYDWDALVTPKIGRERVEDIDLVNNKLVVCTTTTCLDYSITP
ncbi:hypothetical protein HZB01_02975 [Candidatus Woesearchaeota archaeon]|nr:hypothetical protein [Candidatus Woesearchaeota archaeon]